MKITESRLRRIIREEARREFSGTRRNENFGLALSEVSALKAWGARSSHLNEEYTEIAVAAMESKYGRRILISLLKAVKFLSGTDVLLLRHVHAPLWQKARDLINDKFGVNIPISGDDIFNVVKWIAPGHYVGIAVDEVIGLLSDMSDEDYQNVVKKKNKPEITDKESDEDVAGGEEESEPESRKNPPADNKRPMLPEPVDERRIRALVRKEMGRPRR